ncbi:FkbM family methyltransferase [Pinibacter aurantiacus]|uniref:FkbM family methyltransferase n=1 Tax=Pinibacter aurantiacus TaxID=2851599 RepID=A0A9E2SE96_9BACT|nr:FkbM family methyltransferase [Pinibacter aurantiacus]MBV4359459.1 FkbM family methyltransferase [Pinibacter aurantiacus]
MANSFLGKITKGFVGKAKAALANPYKKIGVGWLDVRYLKNSSDTSLKTLKILGGNLHYKNAFEVYHGLSEIFVDEIYKQQLPENARVIDCGSHIGMSLIYLKQLCPTAKITAFEPDAQNFKLLTDNMASFGYTKDVVLENKAVWIENATLHFESSNDMSSHIVADNTKGATISVQAVRLRDVINAKVDFLKIDIEGAEYEVMKDIEEKLHFVGNLFLEYHGNFNEGYKLNEMLQILERNQFKYYIAEAVKVYKTPFSRSGTDAPAYDVQLNIHCFKTDHQ